MTPSTRSQPARDGLVLAPTSVRDVGALLEDRAGLQPKVPFAKCSAEWRTYGEVEAAAERLAAGLAAVGVGPGDRVGIVSANRDELIDVFFACAKLGAVQVPFNTFLKGDFLAYQLSDADLSVVVVDAPGLRALAALTLEVPVPVVVTLDDDTDGLEPESVPASRATSFADVLEAGDAAATRVRPVLSEGSLFAILYTSGTTGAPKGCMLPHGQFLNSPRHHFENGRVTVGDRIFSAFPFFHGSAQIMVVMVALTGGGSFVLTPSFSASTFLAQARAHEAHRLFGVAAMASAILARPASPDDSEPGSIRSAHWIPVSEADQLRFEERFKIPTWGEAFGQTETTSICHTPLNGPRNRRSCGIPMPAFDLAILDDDGYEVPRGTVGEIAVRPKRPHIMYQGYWRQPEASWDNATHYWHHTGDYGRMDGEGFVFFVDRKKQAIRRRGENISSIELENAIRRHPAVADVAVHAVPSDMSEDEVKAVLVLADGRTAEPAELFDFFRDALPYFAVPRYVEIRDALPVNAVGRVMKHVLKDEGVTASTWDLTAMGLVLERSDRRG